MAAPVNDNFADAIAVSIPTIGAVYTSDAIDTHEATIEAGEPGGSYSIWWKYTPAHSGEATFDHVYASATASRAYISVYVGSAVNALSELTQASRGGAVTISVQAGATYYIRIWSNGSYPQTGAGVIVTGQTTTVTRAPAAPALTLIPEDNTLLVQWGVGYQTTWQIRLNGGAWIDKGATGEHLFTGLTIGNTYTVEVQGTNAFGPSPIATRTIVLPNMLVFDQFNRANSTSVPGVPAVGSAPSARVGTWGISANQLYASAVSSNIAILAWSCGTSNVDVRAKRPVPVDSGGLMVGMDATGTNGWYCYFNGATGGSSYVAKYVGSTIMQVLYGKGGPDYITAASVLRVVVNNSIIQMWSDAHLLLEGELPEPLSGTYHGIRATATSHRWDDLTIRESTVIELAADDVALVTQTYAARGAEPPQIDAFVYRGRDTKIYDDAGGA